VLQSITTHDKLTIQRELFKSCINRWCYWTKVSKPTHSDQLHKLAEKSMEWKNKH